MTLVASTLFLIASVAAVIAILHTVRSALPAIRGLKAQLAGNISEGAITVTTMETRDAPDCEPAKVSPLRHRGQTRPKPVTHRLHHFAGVVRAA
ncbi:hypothetical protein WSK_3912 [Novosphingobium sp. Rr 2-17]|uniref:hypothetical protein n=1 Tax=Novosphingobium sp. Rr 2-17 TaxID=555793 RepID=UPI0002699249|nr:hypothetical protein [Novosphingobium sp. Rr 2-17]EIZ77531.1 hypothetical protein WSK_3912 [Novosphingobium sp. Rr 2-17]